MNELTAEHEKRIRERDLDGPDIWKVSNHEVKLLFGEIDRLRAELEAKERELQNCTKSHQKQNAVVEKLERQLQMAREVLEHISAQEHLKVTGDFARKALAEIKGENERVIVSTCGHCGIVMDGTQKHSPECDAGCI